MNSTKIVVFISVIMAIGFLLMLFLRYHANQVDADGIAFSADDGFLIGKKTLERTTYRIQLLPTDSCLYVFVAAPDTAYYRGKMLIAEIRDSLVIKQLRDYLDKNE